MAPRQDKSQVAIETTLTFLDEDQSKALQATVQCAVQGRRKLSKITGDTINNLSTKTTWYPSETVEGLKI